MNEDPADRFRHLLGFLDSDPDNPELLADAVRAGLDANELERAEALVAHLRLITPGSAAAEYLSGLAAMKAGDFAAAAPRFAKLLESDDQPAIRFNLAWSKAMCGDKRAALDVLTAQTVAELPAAAMLRVQLLHEGEDFDGALMEGKAALTRFPDDAGLLAAMATLALDTDDAALARDCASRAGNHPEALAATGVLDLQSGDLAAARLAFARSLAIRDVNPRAWIGQGLAHLADRDPIAAARDLDRGAQQFGDHIGSWIAAGWAHYLAGDVTAAAQRFERALAIDPTFAETQGSLAVIDLARGDRDAARHRTAAALRLDRYCFSAALASSLLASDDPIRAAEIIERAMAAPIDGGTATLGSFLIGLTRSTLH